MLLALGGLHVQLCRVVQELPQIICGKCAAEPGSDNGYLRLIMKLLAIRVRSAKLPGDPSNRASVRNMAGPSRHDFPGLPMITCCIISSSLKSCIRSEECTMGLSACLLERSQCAATVATALFATLIETWRACGLLLTYNKPLQLSASRCKSSTSALASPAN